jgi:chromate transporter
LHKKNKYWQLFLSTFKLSACTFGGGFVIIPLMRERFVKELHWIEEEEMLDLTAIAQSSPGSIAINASILVGYHVAGIPGALITVVGRSIAAADHYFHHLRILSGVPLQQIHEHGNGRYAGRCGGGHL